MPRRLKRYNLNNFDYRSRAGAHCRAPKKVSESEVVRDVIKQNAPRFPCRVFLFIVLTKSFQKGRDPDF
jgi:hypothetical protein